VPESVEQVDHHIVGAHKEQVVVRVAQDGFAFRLRGEADGLHDLNAKRLDDGLEWHR
jgi:hypothetical protein